MKAVTITFFEKMSDAPYDEVIYLLFDDHSVQTGVREKLEWVTFPGQPNEKRGSSDFYQPYGVGADYDSDTYFEREPVGWAYFYGNDHLQTTV